MKRVEVPMAKLNNGVKMPMIGLGMFEVPPGRSASDTALAGIEEGYVHIDTAQAYRNEGDVGEALKRSGVKREEIFITTKLSNKNQGYDSALSTFEDSLKRLGTSYVDLFILHWPVEKLRKESYRALEKLANDGKCRAIGVSNFTIRHLEDLLGSAGVVPAVNQVEFHPFLYQKELLEYCRRKGIQLEAYSPLVRGERINHPKISEVAKRNEITPAQVYLSWALHHGVVVIPKTTSRERMRENLESRNIELSESDMSVIDSLNENYHTCWDPTDIP